MIRQVESGIKIADLWWEFGLVNCAIQTIRQDGTKIISAFEQRGSRVKGFWKSEGIDVDETLPKWFTVRPLYRTGVSLLSRERFLYI